MWSELHFIRPWWLLAMPIALLVTFFVWQLRDARLAWRDVIAPPLLDALLIRSERRRRLIPVNLLAAAAVLTPVALAGPTWEREPSPFAEETAALVIVVETTKTMESQDVPPTRLARAGQKVSDLLALRPDTHAGLIAYAGSAHVAMPITRDASVVSEFAAALAADVMPRDGDRISEAVELANEQLRRAGRSGSILLISDGVPDDEVALVRAASSVPVHVLAMSAGVVPASLDDLASATSGSVTLVTADQQDVKRLADRAQRNIGRVAGDGSSGQWRDMGYWLVPVIALLTLVWSRRGWVIRYSTVGGDA